VDTVLSRRKNVVVTSLFVLGGAGFVLGLVPDLAPAFWVLWLTGCGASILGLILAATVPRVDDDRERPPGTRGSVQSGGLTRRR